MVAFDVCQTIPIDLYSNNRNIITTEEQQNNAPKEKWTKWENLKEFIQMRWLIWIHSNHNARWIFTPSATVTKYIYWHVSHLYESFVKRNEKFSFHRFVFLFFFLFRCFCYIFILFALHFLLFSLFSRVVFCIQITKESCLNWAQRRIRIRRARKIRRRKKFK